MKAIVLEQFNIIINDTKINFEKGDILLLEKIGVVFFNEPISPWKIEGDVIEKQFGCPYFFIDNNKFNSIKKHLNIISDNKNEYIECNKDSFDESLKDTFIDEYDDTKILNGMDIIELLMDQFFSEGDQIYCINTSTVYTFDGKNFLDADNCPISLYSLTYNIFVIKEDEEEKSYYTFNELLERNNNINNVYNNEILIKHKDWECGYSTIQNVLNFMSNYTSEEIYSMLNESVWDFELPK